MGPVVKDSTVSDDEIGDVADAGNGGRAPRDSMFLQAMATFSDRGDSVQLRVRNLSEGGLMADCLRDCRSGDRLIVELRGVGPVAGRIAWCAQGRVGVAFDAPIDPHLARKPIAGPKPQTMTIADLERMRRPGFRTGR
ncbi:hypothetical protein G432_17525 [Sphingomonas sp. MM-1]|uniref:PilZ domain-containing protein n=2 Tax=Edaphosphingomonas TaxID=3423724 RepID=A0A1S1HE30_9SPHN|nr:PilZ domain-containing protein [Sphingomonas sp.]AGH51223.1 hypothetical protein G432_17525 [Sphingomonas sp. MM-1]OHT19756.1 hypothetical protein BHE75_01745 [Sphingomonas haloaromaticamans]